MGTKTDIFDGAATPLERGVTLIEASAGTGKTFAISMLVLRAVVELGVDLKEILVVTYTVAATEELRARIRSRLVEARNLLRTPVSESDPVLKKWLGRIDEREEAIRKLELALLDIDSMGIHTIHGFCQRILAEQVLESDHFFDTELLADTSAARTELVRDYWRRRLYQADARYGSLILGRYRSPQELYQSIRGAENPLSVLVPQERTFESGCRDLDLARERLHTWWLGHGTQLAEELSGAADSGYLKKDAFNHWRDWLDQIESSFNGGHSPDPGVVERLLEDNLVGAINGVKVRGDEKKRALVGGWTLPGEVAEAYLSAVDNLLLAVRLELANQLRTELSKRLHDRGMVSFDELIIDLYRAIGAEGGEQLADQVGSRYKVALIDEFQDTDAAQYSIFSRLFGQGTHHLYLIGDPKQAIYRFRGADIHSYLEARRSVDRRLTLDTNFRSHPQLVKTVNHLLEGSVIGSTAYLPVRSPEPFVGERLVEAQSEQPGLIYCQLDPTSESSAWSFSEAQRHIRSWVVNEVVRLVGSSESLAIASLSDTKGEQRRPVRPCDIGILVRTNQQAEDFFSEFSRRGIPVVLSSSKDVFQTREAADLLLVLRTVATPADNGLLRATLGLDWFGLSGDEYFRVCSDESRFNQFRERFQDYHREWNESSLLLMMNDLLESESVFLHLSRRIQAERRITNIQHLVELVQQQQSQRRLSATQTLIWLQERLTDAAAVQESELRLESDREAVNVVTMHSAKGLEYQIVFCPFLFRSTVSLRPSGPVNCFDPDKGRISDLGSADYERHARLALQEEVDEETRLAYVALTRARLRTYVVWAELKGRGQTFSSFESPLGRLLFPDGECSFTRQEEHLQKLGSADHCQYCLIEPEHTVSPWQVPTSTMGPLKARDYTPGRLQTNRIRTSFSGLTMLSKGHGDERHKAGDETGSESPSVDTQLPGGVRFGNLIHDALETFSFKDLHSGLVGSEQLEPLIRRYGYEMDPAPVCDLLHNAVSTSLLENNDARPSFTLAAINSEQMVKEMEFTLHLDPVSTTLFNRVLSGEPTVSALGRRDLEGYLSGFVDLIFSYRDRYYIVDYKTNNLGPTQAYQPEGLVKAMQVHNYGLQYWLYTLVVHRFLQNWLAGYHYEEHFGGVMYLFVRGMQPEKPGSGVYFDRPEATRLAELDRCFGYGGGVSYG